MALNDNKWDSLNGDTHTVLNGEKIKKKSQIREVSDLEKPERNRGTVSTYNTVSTSTMVKKKRSLGTPIAIVIFLLLFIGCFFVKEVMSMPYEFNRSIPVTLVTVDEGDFNLTIKNDSRYENVLDMVRGDWYEYQSERFIQSARAQKKQYGDRILEGTCFECSPLSGKSIINIQHTTTKCSAGIAVVFGKNNNLGVVCESWYKKVQFGMNSINVEELKANTDETVPDITLKFTHFPNKYKKQYEEIEMRVWIKDNQQTNISLKQISENEYEIVSTAPISQISINGDNAETLKDVGTNYIYKVS